MKHPTLSREIYDSRNIRVIGGFGDLATSGSDDADVPISPERVYNTEIQKEDDFEEIAEEVNAPDEESKHDDIWSAEYEGKPRVISHGDLKFDLGNRIIAVLPIYPLKGVPTPMAVISGEIVDIHSVCVGDRDVPREVKLRVSPDGAKIRAEARGNTGSRGESIYSTLAWATSLVVKDWKEERNRVQTMVVSYKILLDQPFRLNQTEINALFDAVRSTVKLPYLYKTQIQFSTDEPPIKRKKSKARAKRVFEYITISYRYVMGLENACKKSLALARRVDISEVTIDEVQDQVNRSKLCSGVFVQYSDSDSEKRNSEVLNFAILDHICYGPCDIRFVVRCSGSTRRVLAISKLSAFDVRYAYPVDDYHCFHPIDRYVYTLVNPHEVDFSQQSSIREAIHAIFDSLEVYVVKKSLCNPSDIEYNVFEDNTGNVKFVPAEKNSGIQPADPHYAGSSYAKTSYRYSGISIASYVRGLAYPEGNCPTQHDLYTFFNSKDYYEIDLDPDSPTFLEFICTSNSHALFRNPMGKDVILAVAFVCDRDQHKGKTNLRWFYPSDEIRLLHLYVKTEGNHPQFRPPPSNKKGPPVDPKVYLRSMFSGRNLCLIDLFVYGLSKANPTIKSPFTRRFMSQFFWWEKLNLELHHDPNFDYLEE